MGLYIIHTMHVYRPTIGDALKLSVRVKFFIKKILYFCDCVYKIS
jgi:hypothetical protein